jgi:hypothetical protein
MRSVARSSHAGQGTWLGDVALGRAGEVDWPFPDRTLRGSIASLERYDDVESIIVTFIVAAFAWEAVETARAQWCKVADQLNSKCQSRQ